MPASERAVELGLAAAQAAADKLASDILLLDVSEQLVITDVFLLASAPNDRQVKAVVDEIEDRLRELGAKPVRREGAQEGRWVLLDFADIVVHVQHEEERVFYALERLWKDCPVIPFVDRGPRARGRPEDLLSAAPPARPAAPRADRPTTPPAASRASSTPRSTTTAARRPPPSRRVLAALPAVAASDQRPAPGARHRRAAGRRAAGLRRVLDPRLRELDLGAWQGLTSAEARERFPEEHAAWRAGDDVPRGRRRDLRARPASAPPPASPSTWPSVPAGGTLVAVTHGGTARARARACCSSCPAPPGGGSRRSATPAGRSLVEGDVRLAAGAAHAGLGPLVGPRPAHDLGSRRRRTASPDVEPVRC